MKVKLYLFFALVLFGIFLIQIQEVSALTRITDCTGLSNIRNNLAESYVLDNDIVCGSFGNFIPIGGNGNPHFSGTLNGRGYKIIGLSITSNYETSGLFGETKNAQISNLNIINSVINVDRGDALSATGILVGTATTTTITDVKVNGEVNIRNMYGVIGNFWSCPDNSASKAGALAGFLRNSKIYNSKASGRLNTFDESYCCGGGGECSVGGLVGKSESGSIIQNSYSETEISSNAAARGGLVGWLSYSTIDKSYSSGIVVGNSDYIGGFLGYKEGSSGTNNFWDINNGVYIQGTHEGTRNDGGLATGKLTSQMKNIATFSGWDINFKNEPLTKAWFMDGNLDYPRLWHEYVPNFNSLSSTAPAQTKTNSFFTIKCDYGKEIWCVNAIPDNDGTCDFSRFDYTTALFTCKYTTAGTKTNQKCILNNPASDDLRCHYNLINPIGNTNVAACSVATQSTDCNDGNPCTEDTCSSGNYCQNTPKTGDSCDDNNLCTLNDACSAGVCTGTAKCTGVQDCDSDNGECFDKHFCSSENDIIMKLNKPKNSLGSLWNEQGSYDICYSDIFGATLGIPNAHNCFGSSPLLFLASNKNSLASAQDNPFFPNPVCYGGLLCRSVYNATVGLVADYPFENPNPKSDSSQYHNEITEATASFTAGDKKYGSTAYDFNGANQYLKLPASDSLNINGDITISVWVKHRDSNAAAIIHKDGHYSLYVDSNRRLSWADSSDWMYDHFGFYGDDTFGKLPTIAQDGGFHHLVVTKKGSYVIIYLDKQVVVGKSFGGSLTPNSYPTFIGCSSEITKTSCTGGYFNGIIDEVKIFNRALSSGEISDLYDNSLHVENCADDERAVVGLKESSDSKMSISTDTTPFKICCKNPPPSVHWMNMIGEEISEANVSDSVNMVLKEIGISGNMLNFTVYNAAGDIKMSQLFIPTDFTGASVIFVPSEDGTYKFSVNNLDKGEIFVSSDLKVSGVENSMPSVRIIEPVNEAHYLAGGLINFTQESKDVDDDLKITWDFGDSSTQIINNILTIRNGNTNHTYAKSGTRLVKASVQEMTRGQRAEDSSKIYLHKEGTNVFALIDNPNFTSAVVPDFYNVNGSSSFVEKCDIGSCAPGKTCYPVANLFCYVLEDSSKLTFNWTIDGKAFDYVKDNKNFSYFFDGPQEHLIELAVNYTDSGTNIFDKTSVKLLVSGIKCIDGGYHWINGTDPLNPIISNTARNCFIPDANSLIKTCCPRGYACDFEDTTMEYFCNYTGEMYCWDIADKSSCLNATHATVDYTFNFLGTGCGNGDSYILGGRSCYDRIDCSCEWDDTNNNCKASSLKTQCFNPSGLNPAELCEYIPLSWDDKCNESGFIFVKIKATYTGAGAPPPECNGIFDKTITCDQVVKLNFFGFWNFVAVISILIVFYVIKIKFYSKK